MSVDAQFHLHPDDLRVGLFVRLETGWVSHPFPFNSFLVRDASQLEQLRQLGLSRVRCDAARSQPEVLSAVLSTRLVLGDAADNAAPPAVDAEPRAPGTPLAPALAAKRERLLRAERQRERLEACERQGLAAARDIALVQQNLFAAPQEAVQRALQVVDGLIARLDELAEAQLLLMNIRRGGGAGEAAAHELNVMALALMLGRRLGFSPLEQRQLGIACLFHDTGKHELPEVLTRKIGPLSGGERDLLRAHVHHGSQLARRLRMPMEALVAIAQHHELADGSGYPQGLRLGAIGRLGRVLGLVNAFDNHCNPPHALQGLTPHEALKRLFAAEARGYDPEMLNTLVAVVGVYPPGSLVRLQPGGAALVLSANPKAPLRPLVLSAEGEGEPYERIVLDLAQEAEVTIAGAMASDALTPELAAFLNPRRRALFFPG
jgi:HD-GYP domain-containing protein (c-di-GMP phosphodiesterase class II)